MRSALKALVLLLPAMVLAAEPAERMLPIRGEKLLQALSQPITRPQVLSLSPDGSRLLYIETTRRGGSLSQPELDAALTSQRLWVLDLITMRRFELHGHVRLSDSQTLPPQWSHDSSQVAMLEYQNDDFTLLVWAVASNATPARIPLTGLRHATRSDESNPVRWLWLSERGSVVVALSFDSPHDGSASQIQSQGSTALPDFVWFKSRSAPKRNPYDESGNPRRHKAVRLWDVDTQTQEIRQIPSPADRGDAVAPPSEISGWKLSRDRRQLLITGDHRMWLIDTKRMTPRILTGGTLGGAAMLERSGEVIGTDELEGPTSLFAYRGFGVVRRREIRSNREHLVIPEPVPLPSVFEQSNRSDSVYQIEESALERRIYEVSLAARRRVLISPSDFSVPSYAVSADGKSIAAVLENVNTPPEIQLWADGRSWRKLTNYADSIRTPGIGKVEKITWRSKDDRFDVSGFLVKPPQFHAGRKYPLLVFVHGGPFASPYRNRFDLLIGQGGPAAHIFAAAGYLVLLPNFRGDVGHSMEFRRAIVGNLGREYDYDIDAGVDCVIAKGWVDPNRLGIFGHSGGAIQVSYAISHTNRYKAAVISDGIFLYPEVYLPAIYFSGAWSKELVDNWIELTGFDPTRRIWADVHRIKTPLLLRWQISEPRADSDGSYRVSFESGISFDNLLNLAQSQKVYLALKRSDIPVEIVVDRDSHWNRNLKYLAEWQSRLLQWFDHFILGEGENPLPAMKSPLSYGARIDYPSTDPEPLAHP